jgi:hypothetical protein
MEGTGEVGCGSLACASWMCISLGMHFMGVYFTGVYFMGWGSLLANRLIRVDLRSIKAPVMGLKSSPAVLIKVLMS